jgi:O-antigen ligase
MLLTAIKSHNFRCTLFCMEDVMESTQLRTVISWAVIICLGVAMAPWLSGGQEPIAILVSGFALLIASVLLWQQPVVRQLKFGPLMLSYLSLVGWTALSLIWSVNRYSSMLWLVGLISIGLAFRLAYALSAEVINQRRIEWVYLASAIGVVAYGIYLYLANDYNRLTSSFYWPNPAAAYLIPAILLALDHFWRTRRWWWGALLLVFGTGFLLTDSRAAAATFIVVLIIYGLISKLNRWFWILLLFTGIASVGAAYGVVGLRHSLQPKAVIVAPGSRLTPAVATTLQNGSDRITYLKSALNIWFDYPLIGSGAGTYVDIHPHYQIRVISASASAHNEYVQILAELGLVGELLVLWIVVNLIGGTLRSLWYRPANIPAVIGIAGLWLHIGLDIDAQYPAILLLLAIFGGGFYHQRIRYRRLSWWPATVAIVLLIPVIGLYFSDTWSIRGNAAQANGDYGFAAQDFARARSYLIYNPNVLTAQGINEYALAQLGDKSSGNLALALAKSAEKQDPYDGQHYQLAGRVQTLNGDQADALKSYQNALKYDPYNHPEYAYDLALVQLQLGQTEAAVQTATAMLDQYPPLVLINRSADPTLRGNLAQLSALLGSIKLQTGDIAGARAANHAALDYDQTNLRAQALDAVLTQIAQ